MTPRAPAEPAPAERAVARLYRLLLHAYPGSFRADFARDMTDTFVDRYREAAAAGPRATLAFLFAAVADAVMNGLRERVLPHSYGYGMFHWTDLRYALRLLRRSPLFSLLTVITLAGGLGVSIFTFAFLYTAALKPLPLAGGERIVRVEPTTVGGAGAFEAVDLKAIRPAIHALTDVGAFVGSDVVVGEDRHRKVVHVTRAEPNLFSVTRARPMLGRPFTAEDQATSAAPVIVLSYWAWETLFGADSSVVGRSVPLNGSFARVIGVMPRGFGFPVATEAWMPLAVEQLANPRRGALVNVYARLTDGSSAGQASAELTQLLDRTRRERATSEKTDFQPALVEVRPFPMAQLGDEGPLFLTVLNVLALLILLLACINVTNLLLARANERARETAVRLALGASRGRLIVQSMWENVVICLLGGAIATAIAGWGLAIVNDWLRANLLRNLPFWWVWHLDRTAILSACGFVTLTIAILGAAVSWQIATDEFYAVLRDGGTRSGGRREGRIARGLVVAQVVAVSILMFFGVMSGVVAYRVIHMDAGFDVTRLLSSSLEPDRDRFATREARAAFFTRAYDRLVRDAAIDGALVRADMASIEESPAAPQPGALSPRAYVEGVQGSLATMGVRMNTGRAFDQRDDAHGLPVAIVSEALARQYWPGRSPIGERVRVAADGNDAPARTIVGVASDVLLGAPFTRSRSANAVYVPLAQTDVPSAAILFRHRGDVPAAQAALYAVLGDIDSRSLPPDVRTYEEILEKSSLIATSVTKLFSLCFGFALLLAVSGTYGLMARSIGQRTREIGIRRALGSTDAGVMRLLVGQGGRQLGVGVLIALPVMAAVGFGFWRTFPLGTFVPILSAALVSAAIVSIVLLATWIPARRVVAVSPRDAIWRE